MRLSSGTDRAFISRIRLVRCTFTVYSAPSGISPELMKSETQADVESNRPQESPDRDAKLRIIIYDQDTGILLQHLRTPS